MKASGAVRWATEMSHQHSISDPPKTDPSPNAGGQEIVSTPSRSGLASTRSVAIRIARFVKITLGVLVIACLFVVVLGIALNTDAPPRVQLPMYGCFAELLPPLLGLAIARRFKASTRRRGFFLGFEFTFASAVFLALGFREALRLMDDTRPEVFVSSIALVMIGVPTGLVIGSIRAYDENALSGAAEERHTSQGEVAIEPPGP